MFAASESRSRLDYQSAPEKVGVAGTNPRILEILNFGFSHKPWLDSESQTFSKTFERAHIDMYMCTCVHVYMPPTPMNHAKIH